MPKDLNFKQELVAVFGRPVAENPTQVMIEAAFRHHGLEWRYLTIEVTPEDLEDAVRGARAMGFAGFNCTIPHKVAVIRYLDGLGKSAEVMGAVNCVVRRGGRLIGENTDGKGFVKSLEEVVGPSGKKILIFGAGGAARAIAVETLLAGASEILIVNRSDQRGRELQQLLSSKLGASVEFMPWEGDFPVPPDVDVVVNATSVGLYPDVAARFPIESDTLTPGMTVADVIPNPPETDLIRRAAARGCRVLDGLGMLVNQGVIGLKYWTGVDADPGVMRAALEAVFRDE